MRLIEGARRRLGTLSLPMQIGGAGVLVALLAAGVALLADPATGTALAAAGAGGALAAGGLAVLLAQRNRRSLHAIANRARALGRDDAPDDLNVPLEACCAEMRLASLSLRSMVEAAQRRQRELKAQNAALAQRLNLRTHELSSLQDLAIGLASSADLPDLVDEALGALGQTMDYASASLWARADRSDGGHVVLLGYRASEGAGPTGDLTGMRLSRANLQRYEQIERDREALVENQARQSLFSWLWSKVVDDAGSSELYRVSRSWMAVPLRYRDDVLGVMRVDHLEPAYFDAERARLLTAVSSQTALAMHHARLQAQQREAAVVAERNRIARDLHDAVSQTLFASNMLAGALARGAGRDSPADAQSLAAQARALEQLNRGALAEMRLLMFELRPDALQHIPLAELLKHAIEALACRGDIEVDATLADNDSLPQEVRVQLYRIAQEALSNVAKHSGARHCRVELVLEPPQGATLRVSDDGCGFDAEAAHPGHFGVENLRSRAQQIGATLLLASSPGEGTVLRVEWQDRGNAT